MFEEPLKGECRPKRLARKMDKRFALKETTSFLLPSDAGILFSRYKLSPTWEA